MLWLQGLQPPWQQRRLVVAFSPETSFSSFRRPEAGIANFCISRAMTSCGSGGNNKYCSFSVFIVAKKYFLKIAGSLYWIRNYAKEEAQMRKQKKMLARPLQAFAHFPAGFSHIALQEIQAILATPLMPKEVFPKLKVHKDRIHIQGIHYFQLLELLLRARTLADLRLVLLDTTSEYRAQWQKQLTATNKDLYFPQASRFHCIFKSRNGLAMPQLKESIAAHFPLATAEEADFKLYCESYPKRCHLSFSLAGEWLYKRGFRSSLARSAPVREDIAAASLLELQNFVGESFHNAERYIYIPFAGSGTFLFEFLFLNYDLYPGILREHYSIQNSTLFREQHFAYLQNQGMAHLQKRLAQDTTSRIVCVEKQEQTFAYLQKQWQHRKLQALQQQLAQDDRLQIQQGDFFQYHLQPRNKSTSNLFLFLNPPYGKRMQTQSSIQDYYQNIAQHIQLLAKNFYQTAGFIYCPNATISQLLQQRLQAKQSKTLHFTHGGMDMRCYLFSL